MRKFHREIESMLDELKECIDKGHDFRFLESFRARGMRFDIFWKCQRCGYRKQTNATKEQESTLIAHKSLKPPEKAQ
jgi:hypothetical protein